MVHAHLEVVGEVEPVGRTVFEDIVFTASADSDAALKAALTSVVGITDPDTLWDELKTNSGTSTALGVDAGAMGIAINDALKSYREKTNSNREMGHLVMQLIRTHAPDEFAEIADPNPLKWLRFAQYAASQVNGHIGVTAGGKDTKFDIDLDYVASICGIEKREHNEWDGKEAKLKEVTIYQATCTLVHDRRRRYTSDLPFVAPHFVHSHGILNVETISGAYFMSRADWEEKDIEKKKAVGMYAPVYVYTTNIKVPLLKYKNQYYPDLRTTGKIDGITKVGPDGDELYVYANDLYGRIHSDDLIKLQNTPEDGNLARGASSYYVRGGGYDAPLIENVDKGVKAAEALYYFGERADGSHAVRKYDEDGDWVQLKDVKKNSYDGSANSIYQLGARFGTERARDSVLGCMLPMAIRGHASTATYCAYCAPMSLSGTFLGPHTVDTRNPKAGMPTESELAEALSKKGRHNEVGIALQKLMPNKQGDLILFDGV